MARALLAASAVAGLVGLCAVPQPSAAQVSQLVVPVGGGGETIRPTADGTIQDGGINHDRDGIPDEWDWSFDDSGYQGAITMTTETPASSLDRRVVWEYDLSELETQPPAVAVLHFTIRGAPVFPMPDTEVHVYSFPADLAESPEDFGSEPTVLEGSVTITPYQQPTEFSLDVSDAVNEALIGGVNAVAFRFQVNPDTPHDRNQAFIDALDDEPSTKPYLRVSPPDLPRKRVDAPATSDEPDPQP